MSITWNGVSSDTIGVIVERIPNRYVPTRRFSPQQVAGRNGNILLVDKAFPNVEQEYEVYFSAEAQGLPSVARACAEWLMGPDGYCRLEDSYDTTVYREAFLMGGYDLENILNKFGRCTITFSCKPQKYLLTGDTPIEIPAGITTYTGDVAQFDGVTGASITSLSTTITQTQDLHGYDSPWPAGGGKNKLSLSSVSLGGTESRTKRIAIEPIAAGTYKMSGVNTGTATTDIGFQFYDAISGGTNVGSGYLGGTLTLTGEAVSVYCYMSTADYNNGKTVIIGNMQIEAGGSITSYAPYSNICPITGRTGVNVWDDPKYGGTVAWNQLMPNPADWQIQSNPSTIERNDTGCVVTTAGTVSAYNPAIQGTKTSTTVIGHKYWTYVEYMTPDNTSSTIPSLYISTTAFATDSAYGTSLTGWNVYSKIRLATAAGYAISYVGLSNANIVVSVGDKVCFRNIKVVDLTQMFGSTIADYIYSLEQNTAGAGVAWFRKLFPKDYYPYDNSYTATCVSAVNGDPYWKKDIDWTSEAGTVYGGTVDVVSGLLTVDKAYALLNDPDKWVTSGGTVDFIYNTAFSDRKKYATSYGGLICSYMVVNSAGQRTITARWASATSNAFGLRWVGGTLDKVKADAQDNKIAIVYELATPLTYQLSAQEVEALVGENNVWTSSGPVSVTVVAPFVGTVTNPTPFEARPMLEVSGVGEITINGKTIQILESVSDFDIDCESMEAEDNSKIYCMDFPELSGGENEIVGDGSITALTVTPRWWTL